MAVAISRPRDEKTSATSFFKGCSTRTWISACAAMIMPFKYFCQYVSILSDGRSSRDNQRREGERSRSRGGGVKLDSCRLGPVATRRQPRHGGLGGLGGPALPLDLSPPSKEAAEEPTTCAWLRPTWWPLWHTSLRLQSQNGTTGTTKTTETARVDRDGRFDPRADSGGWLGRALDARRETRAGA